MNNQTILLQFNQAACAMHLTGRQMQLWMVLYELLSQLRQQQDRALHTALVLRRAMLDKRQFVRVRQGLIDNGFLSIRHDERQQVYYTLLLHNKPVLAAAISSTEEADCPAKQTAQAALTEESELAEKTEQSKQTEQNKQDNRPEQAEHKPAAPARQAVSQPVMPAKEQPTALWQRRSHPLTLQDYTAGIDDFCSLFAQAGLLRQRLYQWAQMRLQNGWQLTSWGLEVLLENLQELGAGSVEVMERTVAQSVSRRWKGFFAYKAPAKPSGAALCRQEAQQQRQYGTRRCTHLEKFRPEGRDLSILER